MPSGALAEANRGGVSTRRRDRFEELDMLTRLKLGTEAGGAAGRGPVGTASFFAGAELLKSSRRTAL